MYFIVTNWLNILLVLVGLSAFGVYFAQKRDQMRSAATLLKGQIDNIEKSVTLLYNDSDLGNASVYKLKVILQENMWEKYRHLFVKKMTKSEIDLVQSFFDSAEQIEKARKDIVNTIKYAWISKTLVGNYHFSNYANEALGKVTDQHQQKYAQFREKFDPFSTEFTPQILVQTITESMVHFKNLSGTTIYGKLEKWAYDK